jgi:hypothetical protein
MAFFAFFLWRSNLPRRNFHLTTQGKPAASAASLPNLQPKFTTNSKLSKLSNGFRIMRR